MDRWIDVDGCVGLFVCGLPTLVQNYIYIFLRTIYKIVHSPELYINKSELYIYIVGSLVPVTVSTKKAPEKPREKVKKWRFVFQKCRLQKAICFGAALFSALPEVT